MKSAQRYMIFFIIVAVGISIILLPQAAQPVMRTSKGTIVIDAGHGGFDGGATGRLTGVHEDALNLSVAQKLQSLFGKNGYTVVMTREDGDAIGEYERRGYGAAARDHPCRKRRYRDLHPHEQISRYLRIRAAGIFLRRFRGG